MGIHELKGITILEAYGKVLLENIADLEYEELQEAIKQLKDLEHYSHYTAGLWCTDRPDLLANYLKDEKIFWQIDFWEEDEPYCKTCDSTGWVCESHKNLPFEGTSDNGCDCGGAGMPCSECKRALKDYK